MAACNVSGREGKQKPKARFDGGSGCRATEDPVARPPPAAVHKIDRRPGGIGWTCHSGAASAAASGDIWVCLKVGEAYSGGSPFGF